MTDRLRRWFAPAGIILFAAVFFGPELVGGRIAATANMARWRPWAAYATPAERAAVSHNPDCNLSYYPRRVILHEAWKERTLPGWNPYSFTGTPFLADVQSGVFYPPNWILLPFDPKGALGWFLFLHAAWGGVGVWALTRQFGAPDAVAALGGAGFALNGYFAKHFGQPVFLATAAWIPWVLLAARGTVRRPDLSHTALLGLAGAMLFLAGQPQTAFHGAYAALVVGAVTLFARSDDGPSLRPAHALAAFLGAGLLAGLLVTVQLLPTIELASRSARAVLPYSTVVSGSFHPVDAIRFVVPEFFGTPLTGDEWSTLFARGDGFYPRNQLNSIFAGTPVFLLALWGMLGRATWRRALPFSVLFALSAAVAFGTPLARWAYELLPGFRFSRVDRVGCVVVLAQLVPACLAAATLATDRTIARRIFGAVVILIAIGGVVGVERAGPSLATALGADPLDVLDPARVERIGERMRAAAGFAAATGVALLLPPFRFLPLVPLGLAAIQLFAFASPYRGDRRPEEVFATTPDIDRLEALLDGSAGGGRFLRFGRDWPVRPYPLSSVLPPSTNVPYRLRDLQGYNALADRRLGETLENVWKENTFSHGIWAGRRIVAPTLASSLEHPLVDALAVVAVVSGTTFEASGFRRVVSGDGFGLWRNDEAVPRVRWVSAAQGLPAGQVAQRLQRRFDPATDVVWVGAGEVNGEGGGRVEVLADGWNEMRIGTEASTEGLLVVADAWADGWSATVDGEHAPIVAVYGLVRGVIVPGGKHVVHMTYRPSHFRLGVVLSSLGLVLAGLALSVPVRSRSEAA